MRARLLAVALTAVTLALAGAGPAGSAAPKPRETATRGPVTAKLFYGLEGGIRPVHLRLEIWRGGKRRLDQLIPKYVGLDMQTSSSGGKSVAVQDLDADGEPEVLLHVNSGGVHCCEMTHVYRFRSGKYTGVRQVWGEDLATPTIRDENGDGKLEFLSRDSRFGDFNSCGGFACTGFPARIWTYRAGRFLDVTRKFPKLVGQDAAYYRGWFDKTVQQDPRGMAAAWAADEISLGKTAAARAQLLRWARAGKLRCAMCNKVQVAPTGRKFVASLWAFLRKTGYLS